MTRTTTTNHAKQIPRTTPTPGAKKTRQLTMPPSLQSKAGPRKRKLKYYEMKDLMSWRQYDPGPDFAFAIGQALLDFVVDHDDAISFLEFHAWFGIPETTYKRLKRKYPPLQAAHDMAKMLFAVRREKGALEGKYDARTIMFTLHQYHSVWKEVVEDAKNLKRELKALHEKKSQPTLLTVVMPDV